MFPWLVDQHKIPESFLDILIKICSKFKENPLTSFFLSWTEKNHDCRQADGHTEKRGDFRKK